MYTHTYRCIHTHIGVCMCVCIALYCIVLCFMYTQISRYSKQSGMLQKNVNNTNNNRM